MGLDRPDVVARDRARVASYPAGTALRPRTLADHELVLVLAGGATWTSDGTSAALGPGSAVLAVPGTREDYRWDPVAPTRHAYVHFRTAAPLPGAPVVRHQGRSGVLGPLFRYLVWLDAQDDGADGADGAAEVLAATAFDLLLDAVLIGLVPDVPRPDDLPRPVRAALAHVRSAWADGVLRPIPVDRLAAAAATSPRTLARAFTAALGMPPARALEAVRLARAAALVRSGGLPLRSIAATCGFSDGFHLSRRIRQAYGMPPSRLRELPAGEGGADPFPPAVRRLEQVLLEVPGVQEVTPRSTRRPPPPTGR